MRKIVGLGIMLAISLILTNCANATPTVYSKNGHSYDAISTPKTIAWEDANKAAKLMGGHLATITSQDENDFILSTIQSQHNYWIGGYQKNNIKIPNKGWNWVNGEKWSYTNWSPNEPNDYGEIKENKLIFYPDGTWNDDLPDSIYAFGFIVEYE